MFKITENKKGAKNRSFFWQGRQDSNPQPMVLETTTLPLELLPYKTLDFTGFQPLEEFT